MGGNIPSETNRYMGRTCIWTVGGNVPSETHRYMGRTCIWTVGQWEETYPVKPTGTWEGHAFGQWEETYPVKPTGTWEGHAFGKWDSGRKRTQWNPQVHGKAMGKHIRVGIQIPYLRCELRVVFTAPPCCTSVGIKELNMWQEHDTITPAPPPAFNIDTGQDGSMVSCLSQPFLKMYLTRCFYSLQSFSLVNVPTVASSCHVAATCHLFFADRNPVWSPAASRFVCSDMPFCTTQL